MPASYYNVVTGSRIVSSDRTTDHSGSDDTAVTDWTIGTDFVLCVHQSDNGKNTEAGTYKLQWNKDGGSFTDLAATGELNYTVGGATDLTDGTACAAGDWWCTDQGDTDISGTEREDSNATVAFDGSDGDETEHQWAIATDDASGGSLYDFQLVDTANGDRIDAIGVTITMAAAADECTADNILSGTPVLGTPTVGVIHNLTADNLLSGTPSVASPDIGQEHGLTADNIVTQSPVLGTPGIGQEHGLTADNIVSGEPVLGTPTVAEAGADACTADNILAGTPVLGTPSIGQVHVLTADNIESQSPVVSTATIGQIHGLTADNVSSQTPVLETPTVGVVHNLLADNLISGVPVVDSATIGQEHGLTADNIVSGAPILDTPSIGQIHGLTASNIVASPPVLETPSVGIVHVLVALGITAGGATEDKILTSLDGNVFVKANKILIPI
jgi:hypothetical protein